MVAQFVFDIPASLQVPSKHATGSVAGALVETDGRRRGRLKKPAPSHRHGTPSGPWPFLDICDQVPSKRPEDSLSHHTTSSQSECGHRWNLKPSQTLHGSEKSRSADFVAREGYVNIDSKDCWCRYPQSLYPNWAELQQKKSGIYKKITKQSNEHFKIFFVDVRVDSTFVASGREEVTAQSSSLDSQWKRMSQKRPKDSRVRAVFVNSLAGNALRMFGCRYNIEPFFFSSTIGRIPSRFQSNIKEDEDHITITLPFIRVRESEEVSQFPSSANASMISLPGSVKTNVSATPISKPKTKLIIDTQAPLDLNGNQYLCFDFLAVHMVRKRKNSTIISLHTGEEDLTTDAEDMAKRFLLCGKSVYWASIFQETSDPTFLLVCLMWYILYAWDEVVESLYKHICELETKVIDSSNAAELDFTHEMHIVRAHLLHYESLLDEFRKTVEFIEKTENPLLNNPSVFAPDVAANSRRLLHRECQNLLRDIQRIERSLEMQDKRLKNVMDLSFSLVNIGDSSRMKELTEAAVRDSAAMKQIAYLAMVFLPPGFIASCFGMNIIEVNPEEAAPHMTAAKYLAVAIPLTALTVWLVIAYQIQVKSTADIDADTDRHQSNHSGFYAAAHHREGAEAHAHAHAHAVKRTNPRHWSIMDVDPKYLRFGPTPARLLWPLWLFQRIFKRRKFVLETGQKVAQGRFGTKNPF